MLYQSSCFVNQHALSILAGLTKLNTSKVQKIDLSKKNLKEKNHYQTRKD
jgi:hypothetical protein